jgi:hypothetical protein
MESDLVFKQVKHLSERSNPMLLEFVTNYINQHVEKVNLLKHVSNMYVLYTKTNAMLVNYAGFQASFCENGGFILGYALFVPTQKPSVHFIEKIDTRVSGCDFVKHIVDSYKSAQDCDDECYVVPRCMTQDDAWYWAQMFASEFNCVNLVSIRCFRMRLFTNMKQVEWKHLYAYWTSLIAMDPMQRYVESNLKEWWFNIEANCVVHDDHCTCCGNPQPNNQKVLCETCTNDKRVQKEFGSNFVATPYVWFLRSEILPLLSCCEHETVTAYAEQCVCCLLPICDNTDPFCSADCAHLMEALEK